MRNEILKLLYWSLTLVGDGWETDDGEKHLFPKPHLIPVWNFIMWLIDRLND